MAVSVRHSLICWGDMPGGASSTAMRLAWPSQWLMTASCTDFHRLRSMEPSSWRAAVTRSGTMTIVTSSAMVRPLMPVRADSDPLNARPGTETMVGGVVGDGLGDHGDGDVGVRLDGRELDGRPEGAVAGGQRELARLGGRRGVVDAHDVGHR